LVPYDEEITPRELLVGNNAQMNENCVQNVAIEVSSERLAQTKFNAFSGVHLQRLILWYLLLLVLLRFASLVNRTS
jgi:hypothetical protein